MDRNKLVHQLENDPEIWDFIIIGGGATGLGTAVEAASRGYKTLLLDARASIKMVEPVADLLAEELDRDQEWIQQQVEEYTELAKGYF